MKHLTKSIRYVLTNLFAPNIWVYKDGLKTRKYKNYKQYLWHQKSKLDTFTKKDIEEHNALFYNGLMERIPKGKGNVLCLGARTGIEVKAFIDKGYFAVGIDLKPTKKNKYVVYGDFHKLQFANKSIDFIYSNSIDHCLNIDKLIGEMFRVLKSEGNVMIEFPSAKAGEWESLTWDSVDFLIHCFSKRFIVKSSIPYIKPVEGLSYIFKKRR